MRTGPVKVFATAWSGFSPAAHGLSEVKRPKDADVIVSAINSEADWIDAYDAAVLGTAIVIVRYGGEIDGPLPDRMIQFRGTTPRALAALIRTIEIPQDAPGAKGVPTPAGPPESPPAGAMGRREAASLAAAPWGRLTPDAALVMLKDHRDLAIEALSKCATHVYNEVKDAAREILADDEFKRVDRNHRIPKQNIDLGAVPVQPSGIKINAQPREVVVTVDDALAALSASGGSR